MTYRLVHLHLATHGALTTAATVGAAVDLARQCGAALTLSSARLDVRGPSHLLAGPILAGLAADLEAAAAAAAGRLEALATRCASDANAPISVTPAPEALPQQGDAVPPGARASDICVLTLLHADPAQRLNVEAWVFGAGRPCLLTPERWTAGLSTKTCCLAWDAGRSAARAVGDALPLLKCADRVIAVTARNEKPLAPDILARLAGCLGRHGIAIEPHEVDVAGGMIGDVLLSAAERCGAGVLVMGAYGHGRLREFVLGGATRRVLDATGGVLPMSH